MSVGLKVCHLKMSGKKAKPLCFDRFQHQSLNRLKSNLIKYVIYFFIAAERNF